MNSYLIANVCQRGRPTIGVHYTTIIPVVIEHGHLFMRVVLHAYFDVHTYSLISVRRLIQIRTKLRAVRVTITVRWRQPSSLSSKHVTR